MTHPFAAFCKTRPRLDWALQSIPGTGLRMALTFACVCLGWIFFVTGSLEAEARLKADQANARVTVDAAGGKKIRSVEIRSGIYMDANEQDNKWTAK